MRTHTKDTPSRLHARTWSRRAKTGVAIAVALVAFTAGAGGATLLKQAVPGGAYQKNTDEVERSRPQPSYPTFDLPEPGPVDFTFVAAGDVLPHAGVVRSATKNGKYDFSPLFKPIAPYIQGADLGICHMEVPVTPNGVLSGFPRFAAPAALVRDLGESGWDGCTTASNHSVDKGWDGLVTTLNTFDAQRMGHSGTARTLGESKNAQIYNIKKGSRVIQVASLSWTFGTNGLPRPSGKSWSVNVFTRGHAEMDGLIKQAKRARAEGADVVIASIHCCVEYVTTETSDQDRIAKELADSGVVDLVVGHHAHVPQPIKKLKGGPNGAGMWVAYGLGNFVSNQNPECCSINAVSGLLLTVTFHVALDDTVTADAEWTAITVDRNDGHKIYALRDILKKGTPGMSSSEAKARYARVKAIVGKAAKERTEPPSKLADYTYFQPRKPWAGKN